ncbi:bacillithiol biosynthesis deacetylase BshB1 [Alkalicoccus urumqiensis]|uniref:Bacillithiol biosynthesis deacetylase BshB1 n=1 Tax=Alkalicoccus urumqiensis TaxID=1548213 RepID=A0A2P6MKQ3_ALKUR|nr:bacillithiol biosynthesis deacetylase BshB1 [Alkalicoccus urumqiensis]PRO66835.1 bacillithiol biosynthesis deacetylase BshB1 [Alkalicoccus urumqiensis]
MENPENQVTPEVLCIGAHPDDIEIGMGGTAAVLAGQGWQVHMLHLTEAGLSSNGTPEQRKKECRASASLLGAAEPIFWAYPDRGLDEMKHAIIEKLTEWIRERKPVYVFAPASPDRHPDHEATGAIVREAFFNSGIRRYGTLPPFRPENLFYYQVNGTGSPVFTVDISETVSVKKAALSCYESQFTKGKGSVSTPLTESYIEDTLSGNRLIGREAGVESAEGFRSEKLLVHSFAERRQK